MKTTLTIIFFSMVTITTNAQKLPYYEIPEAPKEYTAASVASRMVDGLGFRYYWATEKLRPEDLVYKPSTEGRTTEETINHILALSKMILKFVTNKSKVELKKNKMSFAEKRKQTLENLKKVGDVLRKNDDVSKYKIAFGKTKLPFWYAINGPIADALWHTGQVVSFRRS